MNDSPLDGATCNHIRQLVAKRRHLEATIGESLGQFVAELHRSRSLTEAEMVEIWQEARSWDTKGAPNLIASALGISITKLVYWRDHPPAEVGTRWTGTFPLNVWPYTERQVLPIKGTPCVYLLLRGGEVIYIGFSENVQTRIKAHWTAEHGRSPKRMYGMDRWEVIVCRTKSEAWDLEGTLIHQHKPRFNRADRDRRRSA